MSALPALTLEEITARGLEPALRLLPPKMDSPIARVLVLAYGLQESDFRDRRQLVTVRRGGHVVTVPEGPAKSFWQAEVGGGMVTGVMNHPATREHAHALYEARQVLPTPRAVWNAIENDDVLAAGLARLLIYTDPGPLPAPGDRVAAWRMYADRLWRPGKPKPEKFPGCYARALEFVAGRGA